MAHINDNCSFSTFLFYVSSGNARARERSSKARLTTTQMAHIFNTLCCGHGIGRLYGRAYLQFARGRTHYPFSFKGCDNCDYCWRHVFLFHRGHAQRGKTMKQSATLFAVLSAIAMIAAVVAGLIAIGSPSEFRM